MNQTGQIAKSTVGPLPDPLSVVLSQVNAKLMTNINRVRTLLQKVSPTPEKGDQPEEAPCGLMSLANDLRNKASLLEELLDLLESKL